MSSYKAAFWAICMIFLPSPRTKMCFSEHAFCHLVYFIWYYYLAWGICLFFSDIGLIYCMRKKLSVVDLWWQQSKKRSFLNTFLHGKLFVKGIWVKKKDSFILDLEACFKTPGLSSELLSKIHSMGSKNSLNLDHVSIPILN